MDPARFSFKVNDGTVDSTSSYRMTIDVTPSLVCEAPNFGNRRNFWTGTVMAGLILAKFSWVTIRRHWRHLQA